MQQAYIALESVSKLSCHCCVPLFVKNTFTVCEKVHTCSSSHPIVKLLVPAIDYNHFSKLFSSQLPKGCSQRLKVCPTWIVCGLYQSLVKSVEGLFAEQLAHLLHSAQCLDLTYNYVQSTWDWELPITALLTIIHSNYCCSPFSEDAVGQSYTWIRIITKLEFLSGWNFMALSHTAIHVRTPCTLSSSETGTKCY